jgi:hypothetical protein
MMSLSGIYFITSCLSLHVADRQVMQAVYIYVLPFPTDWPWNCHFDSLHVRKCTLLSIYILPEVSGIVEKVLDDRARALAPSILLCFGISEPGSLHVHATGTAFRQHQA